MAETFRILVTGSRDFGNYAAIVDELGVVLTERMAETSEAYPRITVVHGAARGTDTLAGKAAGELGMKVEEHPVAPADWDRHGKRAGFIRNAEMVSLGADVCLAFYQQGATNRGTAHCAGLAKKAGIPVREIWGGG